MKHCTICQKDVGTVGQVRGCSKCHQTGSAAGMHASLADTDPIEKAIEGANPGALPFEDCVIPVVFASSVEMPPMPRPPAEKEGVIAKVKRAYNRVAAKATKKK